MMKKCNYGLFLLFMICSVGANAQSWQWWSKANGVSSAYLMVLGYYTGDSSTTNNYILNTDETETTINISDYQAGFYTVALVCDGNIIDAKTLIKN